VSALLRQLSQVLKTSNHPLPAFSESLPSSGSRRRPVGWTTAEDLRLIAAIARIGAKDWRVGLRDNAISDGRALSTRRSHTVHRKRKRSRSCSPPSQPLGLRIGVRSLWIWFSLGLASRFTTVAIERSKPLTPSFDVERKVAFDTE
jgi:hypothetical protein